MGSQTIAFVNNKGGSGKSTCCCNIAFSLATLGKSVLIVDGDMQSNVSLAYLGDQLLDTEHTLFSLYDLLTGKCAIEQAILPTAYEGVDCITASPQMSNLECLLTENHNPPDMLKNALAPVVASNRYDYILIDSPPTLGQWVINILGAADHLIIPAVPTPWALYGMANLFEFIEHHSKQFVDLSILGVLITQADERKSYFKQALTSLQALEHIHVFANYIRIDSAVEWSQEEGKPILAYKRTARSGKEYIALTQELLSICERSIS